MVDIWQYKAGDLIKLTDIDGKIYIGKVAEVWDKEESEDEDSDMIDMYMENYVMGFRPTEIRSIEKLN